MAENRAQQVYYRHRLSMIMSLLLARLHMLGNISGYKKRSLLQ